MSYLLSGGSRGLNPWIEATACQVVTVPPAGGSDATTGSATTTTTSSGSQSQSQSQRKPRIVQVLGRGGGWVDPATISADHPQLRRGDRWCLSCPPVLVLSDGRNTVTAFLTPPPRSAASGTTMAQNNTAAAAAAGNAASNAPSNARLPSEEVSRICRRGTLIRIRDWTYTTMMLGGGRHYRHLTGTTGTSTSSAAATSTSTCVTAAVLPQNVPLTTPLALSVPWSSVEFIAGENGTVPIHRSNALVDVNAAVEVRRILADNGGSGGGSGTGIGPRNHLELSRRIRGWEEHFADIGTGADAAAAAAAPSSLSRRTAAYASSAAVTSLPPVRVSAAHADAILAGRPRAPPTRADDTSASSNKPMATTVRLGDPAKLVGTRRNLSALLRTGTRRSGDENRDRQQQQGRMQEQEREEPQRHRHGERRDAVRVGDASRLLSSSAGRAALRGSVQVASIGGSATAGAAAATENTSQNNDDGVAGINTAGVEGSTAAKNKTVSVGDVRRLMASKKGRTALRSALSRTTIESANAPAAIAAPAPAPVPAAEPVQAPPPSQKRRRGGVPKRSRQQQEASTNEGASANIATKTKPTSAQETLAALQSLDTASLHSLFNQILSSGVEPEDDVERDSEEVPAPRKLAAMREAPTREGESSNGKEDEPLDLTFLLSDNEEVESSPDDGRGDEKKKAAADEDDESDDNDEEEEESEPVVGIGDMLVPPTQEQQQGDTLSHDEQPVGAKRSQDESESAISKQVASGHSEVEEPAVSVPPDDAVDTNLQPEDESDEEDLSQETTQGSGENTAEGSPKKCPPTLRGKVVEEVDSDATVDENEASRHVAITTEKPKEHEVAESSDSDTTAGEAELRLPITSSKKITKPAPTTTATNESSNQGARSHAVPPPPKSRRRLYSTYDSSSSSDSDDWDSSTPAATTTKKKEGGTMDARKRLKHFGAAPPSAKRPRPAPKKAPVSAFSIQAMLARKRK